ncbi:MAG TPA: hypothetical protein ENJ49_00405, partial [Candidatus Moranbacteria bacterium]|nr:hypothetical protein [Candidatus Moranbacteria bacterium]
PKGKHIEIVGSWDPHQKKGNFNADRIKYWLGEGAQASDSVHNLLVAQRIIEDKKRPIKISKKKADDETKEGDGKDDGNDSASSEKDANVKEEGSEKNESNEENAENKDDKKDDDSEGKGDK